MGIASPVRKNVRAGLIRVCVGRNTAKSFFDLTAESGSSKRLAGFPNVSRYPMLVKEEMQQSLCRKYKKTLTSASIRLLAGLNSLRKSGTNAK